MTIHEKIVTSLTKQEVEYSLTYVMFSRVHKFLDIGLKDSITLNRLCTAIFN